MARITDLSREHTWRQRRQRQISSGLSIAAFCARERISVAPFYAFCLMWSELMAHGTFDRGLRRARRAERSTTLMAYLHGPHQRGSSSQRFHRWKQAKYSRASSVFLI